MVRTFPSILGLNPEKNIETKMAWLRETLDLDEDGVIGLVKVYVAAEFSRVRMCACVHVHVWVGAGVRVHLRYVVVE